MAVLAMVGGLFGFIFAIVFIAVGLKRFAGVGKELSLSNVQVILWTGVIAGTYVAMAVLRQGFLPDINTNLLGLMGVSGGSLVGATVIRTLQQPPALGSKQPSPPRQPTPARTRGLLAQEKKPEELSIAKLQMFTWTIVTLVIYVIVAAGNLLNNQPELPDIGSGLLVLMGISHGAYLGNKITDKPVDF